MKKIYFVRSAKAENFSASLNDFERSLKKKGLKDVRTIGSYLSLRGVSVDIFFSSCALRAEETTLELAKDLDFKGVKYFLEELYFKPSEKIINIITAQDNDSTSICIVGHNPQLNELINILSNKSVGYIAPMAVVALSFDTENWSELKTIKGNIEFTIYPKELKHFMPKKAKHKKKSFKNIDKYLKHNLEKLDIFNKELKENVKQTIQNQLNNSENLKEEIQDTMQKYSEILMDNINKEIKKIDDNLSKNHHHYEKIEKINKLKNRNISLISSTIFTITVALSIAFWFFFIK